jgi:hypothetical protein
MKTQQKTKQQTKSKKVKDIFEYLSSEESESSNSSAHEQHQLKNRYHPSPNGPAQQWQEFFQQQKQIKKQEEQEDDNSETEPEPITMYQPTLIDGPEIDYLYGDDFETNEEDFVVFLNNPNGIKPSAPDDWCIANKILRNLACDAKGLPETNADWKHGQVRRKFHASEKKFDKHSLLETSNSDTRFNQTYQPGGTATTLSGKHSGRMKNRITDKSGMGRWSGFQIKRSEDRFLAIITAYRVVQHSVDRLGALTAYHQQHTMMVNSGNKNPEPRKQCLTDLTLLIKELQRNKCAIILMIDANETLESPNSGIRQLADQCNMVDAIEHRHGINDNTNSCKKGSKKIDHILVSSDIAQTITKCAILPFDTVYVSDHRGIYAAFDSKQLFQARLPEYPDMPRRGLYSTRPKIIAKYNKIVDSRLQEQKEYIKLDEVDPSNKTTDEWPDLERIDKALHEIVLETEKKIQGPSLGPWSPPIEHAAILIRYWRIQYANRRKKRDISKILQSLYNQLPEEEQKKTEKTTSIRAHLRRARKNLRTIRIDSEKLRQDFLQEQAEAYANHNNTGAAAALNELIKREAKKKMYDNISSYYKNQDRSGIKRILFPLNDPPDPKDIEWGETTEPKEVQNRLLERNKDHFRQANGTPFTVSPLIDIFGQAGTNQAAEDLYNGIVPELPDTVSEEVKAIINKLAHHRLPEFDCTIPIEEAKGIFNGWRESTSTSPSGRHLGHYKATLAPDGQVKDPTKETAGDRIFQLYVKIMNTAINEGYSLKRWQTVVSSMIEKIPGLPRIDKIRVIHIFEADYGAIGKYIYAGKMMKQAEDMLNITNSAYGGRKGRKTHDMLLLKELKYEYPRITKTGMATFDNDATACYDRITVLLASLICRNKGVPRKVCDLLSQTLIKMIYYIQTGFGRSVDCYSSLQSTQLQGTGQGHAGSGPIWTMHFSIINDCYEEMATGTLQHDPTGKITLKQASEGFVDDAYLFVNNTNNNTETIQKDAQTWERLLHATGGKLSLNKCFYYNLEWKFDHEGRAKAKSIAEIGQPTVEIKESDTGKTSKITQHECWEAHKTLGVWKSLDGNQRAQKADLEKKNNELIRKQASAYLTRQETYLAHEAVYMSKIAYPLAVTYFTQSVLEHMHSKALQEYIPKMGYNIHFPRAILHAPHSTGGGGVRTPYGEQGAVSTNLLIQHVRCNTTVNWALRIHLGWIQLVAGTSKPILEDTSYIPHFEGEWIREMRTFMDQIQAKITIEQLWMPHILRDHDEFIMDKALEYTKIRRYLKDINRVRIYLQAITIAEIADEVGEKLSRHTLGLFYSKEATTATRSTLKWPVQPNPGSRSWTTWRRFLKAKIIKNTSTMKLKTKLGTWNNHRNERTEWSDYVDPTTKQYFRYNVTSNKWDMHLPVQRAELFTTSYNNQPDGECNSPPPTKVPAYRHPNSARINIRASAATPEIAAPTPPSTWEDYVQQQPSWIAALLQNVREVFKWNPYKLHITKIGVSDGGAKDQQGSYGWTLNIDQTTAADAKGTVGGNPETMNSFRTEAHGLLSLLVYIQHHTQYHQTATDQHITFHVYSDNSGLVKRSTSIHENRLELKDTTEADFDLIAQIHEVRKQLEKQNVKIDLGHVKGHQDETRHVSELSTEAQLNVKANDLATDALNDALEGNSTTTFYQFPAAQCHLTIDGVPVLSNVVRPLRDAFHFKQYKQYLTDNLKWTPETIESVNWIQTGRAMKFFNYNDQVRIRKLRHKWLPTNRYRNRMAAHISSECPLCHQEEHQNHVFQCQHPTRKENVKKEMIKLMSGLKEAGTNDHLRDIISKAVMGWIDNNKSTHEIHQSMSPHIVRTIDEQNKIGWDNFLAGFIGKKWTETIRMTSKNNKSGNKYNQWYNKAFQLTNQFSINVWMSRNEDMYGKTTKTKLTQEAIEYLAEIQALYTQAGTLPIMYQYLTQKSSTEWQGCNTMEMRAWLVQARPIIKRVDRLRKSPPPDGGDIRAYFAVTQ